MPSASTERERWNQKYRETPGVWLEPDPFLAWAFSEHIQPLFPRGGRALDLAGGAGRHSTWLAKLGWDVTLIDLSETGVELARQNAGPLASHIHCVIDDLTQFRASQTQFDVVLCRGRRGFGCPWGAGACFHLSHLSTWYRTPLCEF